MAATRRQLQLQSHAPSSPPSVPSDDPEFSPIGGAVSAFGDDGDVHPAMEKKRPANRRPKLIRLLCTIVLSLFLFATLSLLLRFRRPPLMEEISGRNAGPENAKDELLGGLLSPEFSPKSCISRHESQIVGQSSLKKPPSLHLLQKLRSYEALHQKCGPGTGPYRQALLLLKSNHTSPSSPCKYLIWISFSGLGNRILTLAAAFLYALLTDRILLIDRSQNMDSLFCEPFPNQTWLLPLNFPLPLHQFHSNSSSSLGNLLSNNLFDANLLQFVYLHLSHDYSHHDKLFFCEQQQSSLRNIPWLLLRSDNYFAPSLFLVPSFRLGLDLLFPYKDLVFHHLGRYLFHPSNSVWGMISRFYRSYLQDSDEKIGIQIRVFDSSPGPFPHVVDQVLSCVLDNNLLPRIKNSEKSETSLRRKKKAVLITSLRSEVFQKVKNMYWENGAEEDEVVSIYQPSSEEHQRSGDRIHAMKAWGEMYLLSLTDVLVTSAWSTFGYVAQGLGGMRPWLLVKAENRTAPVPPCRRGESMEPCFHAPPFYDCEKRRGVDTGKILPYLRHCEDVSWGIKLVGYGGR